MKRRGEEAGGKGLLLRDLSKEGVSEERAGAMDGAEVGTL